eukprot:c15216_g1_i1.p1 GENE.c15216_g1_i1~~c15216_g1_i1.p1  ORF type:complete len:710 (+),score=180.42 c15216_g1_i1:60-2189(+)
MTMFKTNRVQPTTTSINLTQAGTEISSPGLENPGALVQRLRSLNPQTQLAALGQIRSLTKWTARRYTDNENAVDENWRIFYIEHGNRDKVFSAPDVVATITPLLVTSFTSTPESSALSVQVQHLALQCLSNLAREASDSRASILLGTNIIEMLSNGQFLSSTVDANHTRLHTSLILGGLLGAPKVGREAYKQVLSGGFLPALLSVVVDKDTALDTQIAIVGVMGCVVQLANNNSSISPGDEWCGNVLRVVVSLCQGSSPALQCECLLALQSLVRASPLAKLCVENGFHKVLAVLLHPHNPAVFKGKHATQQMNNGVLVCKVLGGMCLDDWCYTQIATTSSTLIDMLGFLRSGLETNRVTPHQKLEWENEIADAVSLCRLRKHDISLLCFGVAWLLTSILMRSTQTSSLVLPADDLVMQRLRDKSIVDVLKLCATSSDAFVYQFAARALAELELFEEIPFYQIVAHPHSPFPTFSPPIGDVHQWTEDDVFQWVSSQRFAVYEPCFRSSWVDGELLVAMTDADLAAVGITNPIHRKFILRAIRHAQHRDGDSSALSLPTPIGEHSFNVFISYRRSTGMELAQLLKMHLENIGFKVFLDIDCLGKGDFITHILNSLESSQHFVPILTNGESGRSVGYFDRCRGDEIVDNVLKEIVHAVKLKKNIVPVFVDGYVWPHMDELPDVCRNITSHNAVEWIPQYHTAALEKLRSFLQ